MPVDSVALAEVANRHRVPVEVMYAVAWKESRSGVKGNNYRGPGREVCDSLGCRRVCREVGRLQINPCIRWKLPGCDSLRVYVNNLNCGAGILKHHYDRLKDWAKAIRKYNGSGHLAEVYKRSALEYIGFLRLRELN